MFKKIKNQTGKISTDFLLTIGFVISALLLIMAILNILVWQGRGGSTV